MLPQTITIDGPAGAGKGTVGKFLAKALDFVYVDSGLFYRYAAWNAENDLAKIDESFFVPVLSYLQNPTLEPDWLPFVRKESTGALASRMSTNIELRACINGVIRAFAQTHSIVIDGRDTGTVLFPNATLKLFITADVHIRAKRRLAEMRQVSITQISADDPELRVYADKIEERDRHDKTRAIAPLKQAPDAIIIDTSKMNVEEANVHILQVVQQYLNTD